MENQPQIHVPPPVKSSTKLFSVGSGPEADWKIILLSTVVLILLVTGINIFFFFRINNEEVLLEEGGGENPTTLSIEALKETADYYQNKAVEFQRILNGTSVPADPSI